MNYGSLGSVQEMAGGWWKARVFSNPGSIECDTDPTQRFENLKDAKAWVAVTCQLEK